MSRSDSTNKILSVDLGKSKIGLAVGYEDGPVFGLDTIMVNGGDIVSLLVDKVRIEEIDKIIFGLPLSADIKPTKQSKWVKKIGRQLAKKTAVEVDYADEYLTSQQSTKELDREIDIDQQSAILILKDYLDEK